MVVRGKGDLAVTPTTGASSACSASSLLVVALGYTLSELERFKVLETNLTPYLRAAKDYSSWRASHLAGPLRVVEFREAQLSVIAARVGRRGGRSAL